MTNKNIDTILESLIEHKVVIKFTQHEEPTLRETYGLLKYVNKDIIHMEIYDVIGNLENYYLNRHACALLSVTDEGVK